MTCIIGVYPDSSCLDLKRGDVSVTQNWAVKSPGVWQSHQKSLALIQASQSLVFV
jgi:hypothetical protein